MFSVVFLGLIALAATANVELMNNEPYAKLVANGDEFLGVILTTIGNFNMLQNKQDWQYETSQVLSDIITKAWSTGDRSKPGIRIINKKMAQNIASKVDYVTGFQNANADSNLRDQRERIVLARAVLLALPVETLKFAWLLNSGKARATWAHHGGSKDCPDAALPFFQSKSTANDSRYLLPLIKYLYSVARCDGSTWAPPNEAEIERATIAEFSPEGNYIGHVESVTSTAPALVVDTEQDSRLKNPPYTIEVSKDETFLNFVVKKVRDFTWSSGIDENALSNSITANWREVIPGIRRIYSPVGNKIAVTVDFLPRTEGDITTQPHSNEQRQYLARSILSVLPMETLKFAWLLNGGTPTSTWKQNGAYDTCPEAKTPFNKPDTSAPPLLQLVKYLFAVARCDGTSWKGPHMDDVKKATIDEFPNGKYIGRVPDDESDLQRHQKGDSQMPQSSGGISTPVDGGPKEKSIPSDTNHVDSKALPLGHVDAPSEGTLNQSVPDDDNAVDLGAETKLVDADEQVVPRAPSHFDASTGAQTIVILQANLVDQMATVATLMSSLGRTSIGGAANVQILNTYIDLVQRAMIQIESIDTQLAQVKTAQGLVFTKIKDITQPVA